MIKQLFIIIVLCNLFWLNNVYANDDIEIVILRSEHLLQVKKNDIILRSFTAAFGSGGNKTKRQQGDYITPKGSYKISNIRSSGRFHLFMQINYPSIEDADRGLKNYIITQQQYQAIVSAHNKNKLPPQNTALGGIIGLHGIGVETQDKLDIHQFADWTQGCIALRNDEIDDLKRYIKVGTKVTITD